MKTLHNRGIFLGHSVSEGLGSIGRWDSGGVQEIFRAPRNSMERPTVFVRRDFLIRLLGLCEREFRRECNDTAQLRIGLRQSLQINSGELL